MFCCGKSLKLACFKGVVGLDTRFEKVDLK